MTIEEFMKEHNLKHKSTVIKWLNNDYIPGATKQGNVWIIPNSARIPYTKHNIKSNATMESIWNSITKGCNRRQHVSAKIYKLPEDDFNYCIDLLTQNGYINSVVKDGITYYNITEKYIHNLNKPIHINININIIGINATGIAATA